MSYRVGPARDLLAYRLCSTRSDGGFPVTQEADLNEALLQVARDTAGFMPEEEGLALYRAGLRSAVVGPSLEIGSYCGRSSVFLGAAAQERDSLVFSVDHHRGSEEHQPGQEYHDPGVADPDGKGVDTLPCFARTIARAGLRRSVLGIAARSIQLASIWKVPLGLLFIDGGHSAEAAHSDLDAWVPHLSPGGLLCIHDVFPDPRDGGRAPFEIYRRALDSGNFAETDAEGSLRILSKSPSRIG